ncbi:DUF2971 domain-containing protein [Shewanella waksmanii]|uniref:DUF2971 domain-containing protein n=1 Tax=Shewanella waksmanii TaxID=213783 RepID=UPI003734C26E
MSNFKNIYKFRSMNINSLSTLANNTIWFSSKEKLNDPFEGIVKINEPHSQTDKVSKYLEFGKKIVQKKSGLSTEQSHDVVNSRYLENPNDFLNFVDTCLSNYKSDLSAQAESLGVFSTASDIPNDPRIQVSNMLLWAHYADEFKGFCVKYDLDILKKSLVKLNPDVNFAWTAVNYVNEPHTINLLDDVNKSALEYFKSIQCKHEQWSYECEIRFVATKTGIMSFSPEAIKAVYIGEKMSQDQQALLIGVIKYNLPKADIYKVSTNKDQYEIVTQKI